MPDGLWGQAAIDDEEQRAKRDAVLKPGFYERYFPGCYIFLDKGPLALFLQKERGLDTIVCKRDGVVAGIQEKIIRWKGRELERFFLETMSCTVKGHESPGWMRTSQAEFLLYCFTTADGDLDCWLIDLGALQRWFWPREQEFEPHRMEGDEHPNHALGRKVPIELVRANVLTWRTLCLKGVISGDSYLTRRAKG